MQCVFMRFPNGKAKAVTFSYDDGVKQDKRLAELFTRYGIKATFNFNNEATRNNYTKEQIFEYFLSKGHEIAVHGAAHRPNGKLRPVAGIREVLDNRLELEKKCDRIIRGMAYPDTGITQLEPYVSYEQIKAYLTELDIAYARTLGGDNDRFSIPSDFHAWMPSAHHDNPQIMAYIDKFITLDVIGEGYLPHRNSRLLYIWGHSYELDMKNNWDHMETICQKLSVCDDIWFATNIEIYDYIEAYNRLQYSADGTMVYNPTLFTIWLDVDRKVYTIEPGQTIRIAP